MAKKYIYKILFLLTLVLTTSPVMAWNQFNGLRCRAEMSIPSGRYIVYEEFQCQDRSSICQSKRHHGDDEHPQFYTYLPTQTPGLYDVLYENKGDLFTGTSSCETSATTITCQKHVADFDSFYILLSPKKLNVVHYWLGSFYSQENHDCE